MPLSIKGISAARHILFTWLRAAEGTEDGGLSVRYEQINKLLSEMNFENELRIAEVRIN